MNPATIADWEDIAIADPAIDFADLYEAGPAVVEALIASYRHSGGTFGPDEEYRARRWWEARGFMMVAFAMRQDNDALLEDAVSKFRRGPVITGWEEW